MEVGDPSAPEAAPDQYTHTLTLPAMGFCLKHSLCRRRMMLLYRKQLKGAEKGPRKSKWPNLHASIAALIPAA